MDMPNKQPNTDLTFLGPYQTVEGHEELEQALGGIEQFNRLESLFRKSLPERELGKLHFDAKEKTVHLVMEHAAQFFNTYSYQVAHTLPCLPSDLLMQLRSGIKPLDRFVTYLLTSVLVSHLGCITTLGQILLTQQEQDGVFERMLHPSRTNHRPIPRSLDSRFIVSYVEDVRTAYCLLPDQVQSFTRYSSQALTNDDILASLKNRLASSG